MQLINGFEKQIIFNLTFFLAAFLYLRSFIHGIKTYQLNLSAYKKRKKSESFIEWFFYIKYKKEIPRFIRLFYYFILLLHPICLISCIVLHYVNLTHVGDDVAFWLTMFDASWLIITKLLFWHPKRPDFIYERWIKKRRGQKPKKK